MLQWETNLIIKSPSNINDSHLILLLSFIVSTIMLNCFFWLQWSVALCICSNVHEVFSCPQGNTKFVWKQHQSSHCFWKMHTTRNTFLCMHLYPIPVLVSGYLQKVQTNPKHMSWKLNAFNSILFMFFEWYKRPSNII